MLDTPEAKAIFKSCHRFLSHDYPKNPRHILSELAETADPDLEADRYGQGELITAFEQEVAGLLGKESAVFMPSGTMCQQIALRIWAGRRGTVNVAFHPKSHLEIAALLTPCPEITIVPDPPHTNMMHLFLRGERARLEATALEIARETGIWLFSRLAPTMLPGLTMLEWTVGEATLDVSNQEIVEVFQQLLTRASV